MKAREKESSHAEGRRPGGLGVVEVGEEKRRWIYEDDPEGARKLREREMEARARAEGAVMGGREDLRGVERYSMVAKRIW